MGSTYFTQHSHLKRIMKRDRHHVVDPRCLKAVFVRVCACVRVRVLQTATRPEGCVGPAPAGKRFDPRHVVRPTLCNKPAASAATGTAGEN